MNSCQVTLDCSNKIIFWPVILFVFSLCLAFPGQAAITPRLLPIPLADMGQLWEGGQSLHSCALTTTANPKCWGYNAAGQLGNETTLNSSTSNDVVDFKTSGVKSITLGWLHSCVLTPSGGVKCWGYNSAGQLGNGTTKNSFIPVEVRGFETSGAVTIALGNEYGCVLTSSGGVKCWGRNSGGQLGNGTEINSLSPIEVKGFETGGALAIASGSSHTCALTTAGGVKCWGHNERGQLGNGTVINSFTPVDVIGFETGGAVAIALGNWHSCAITISGGVKCWGNNAYGQLGNGTTMDNLSPVHVSGFEKGGVARLTLGNGHSCALTTSGGVKCWGWNFYGQLGDGTTTNSPIPISVTGFKTKGAMALASGWSHNCILTPNGGIECWGDNSYGQLGDNTTTNSLTPTDVLILPSLELRGKKNILIPTGHTSPSLSEGTDFGQVKIGTQINQVFTLQNPIGGIIHFSGSESQIVCSDGVTPSFNVEDVEMTASNPYIFHIGLTPHTYDAETCTVALSHNGPDKNPYTFTLTVQGVDKLKLIAHPPAHLTRLYGTANPPFFPTYEGWVNNIEPIDGPPTLTTSATLTSPPGDYLITCSGGRDDNYLIVCGPPGTLTVTAFPTKTTFTTSTVYPSSASGDDITFRVTVTPLHASSDLPTGEVEIYQGTTFVCKAPLVGTSGTCTAPLHGMGFQTLTAHYSGDAIFQESVSHERSYFLLQAGYASTPAPGETLHFGSGPTTFPLITTLTFQETGNQRLTIALNRPTDDPNFKILSPELPLSIAHSSVNSKYSLTLSCTPTSPGLHTATLELVTNDPSWPIVTYPLVCEGQPLPSDQPVLPFPDEPTSGQPISASPSESTSDQSLSSSSSEFTPDQPSSPPPDEPIADQPVLLSPGYDSFPPVNSTLELGHSPIGQSIVFSLSVQETGNADLHIHFLDLTGPQANDFQVNSSLFPFILKDGTGTTQAIEILCAPSALGKRAALLTLSTNDPQYPTVTYSLECEGIPLPTAGYLSFPDHLSPIDFGSGFIGQPITFDLSLTETGNTPLIIELKDFSGSQLQDFSIVSPTFPITIPDGAPPQFISLRCIPSASGRRTAQVTFSTNDPQHPLITYLLQCTGQEILSSLEMTQIKLSHQTVAVFTPADSSIGTFQTEVAQSPFAKLHFVYQLLNDAQGTFKIVEDQLVLAKTLTFEQPELYQIIVKSTEPYTRAEKNAAFVINVRARNHAPTTIQLSHTQVGERTQGLVGKLTTLDPDEQDTHSYTLISGGQFFLENGNEIRVAQDIVFKRPDYLVRITSTDAEGLSVTQEFTLDIQAEPQFSIEVENESGETGTHLQLEESEMLTLKGTIHPSPLHLGQTAELIFFYEWTPLGTMRPELQGSKIFARQQHLNSLIEKVPFFHDKLIGLAGTLKIGLGYQIGEETWSEPVMTSVYIYPNRPPTDLKLEMNMDKPLTSETPKKTVIGTLSMEDPDHHEEFTYRLLSWQGYFKIEGNQLLTGDLPLQDREQTYILVIQGRDLNGEVLEKMFKLEAHKKMDAMRMK